MSNGVEDTSLRCTPYWCQYSNVTLATSSLSTQTPRKSSGARRTHNHDVRTAGRGRIPGASASRTGVRLCSGVQQQQRARCTARAVPLLAVRVMPGSALPSDVSPGAITAALSAARRSSLTSTVTESPTTPSTPPMPKGDTGAPTPLATPVSGETRHAHSTPRPWLFEGPALAPAAAASLGALASLAGASRALAAQLASASEARCAGVPACPVFLSCSSPAPASAPPNLPPGAR